MHKRNDYIYRKFIPHTHIAHCTFIPCTHIKHLYRTLTPYTLVLTYIHTYILFVHTQRLNKSILISDVTTEKFISLPKNRILIPAAIIRRHSRKSSVTLVVNSEYGPYLLVICHIFVLFVIYLSVIFAL